MYFRVEMVTGTADDKDFIPETKFVTFQPGETENKTVEIDLIDDDVTEPTEEFTVTLSSSTRVGTATTVRIEDNDGKCFPRANECAVPGYYHYSSIYTRVNANDIAK